MITETITTTKLLAPTRDTHENWLINDPVVPSGILCITEGRIDSDSKEYFIGDGVTKYHNIKKFGTYPIATEDTVGGIKVGDNLTIESDGTLNAQNPNLSVVEYGSGNAVTEIYANGTNIAIHKNKTFLTNDYSSYATETSPGLMSAADKTKLDGIDELFQTMQQISASTSIVNIALTSGTSVYTKSIDKRTSFVFSLPSELSVVNKVVSFELRIIMPTVYNLEFPNTVTWLTPSMFDEAGTYIVVFRSYDGGSTWLGSCAGNITTQEQISSSVVTHTLNSAEGSLTNPVYIGVNGKAAACTYELNKTVPSDAVFTDVYTTQSETSSANYKPIMIGYNESATAGSGMTTTVTNQSYVTNSIYCQPSTGSLYASRIFNVVYNDYAECFDNENNLNYNEIKHRIVQINDETNSIELATEKSFTVIGIISDNYGHLLGGSDEEVENGSKLPIGLAGTLWVDAENINEGKIGNFICSSNEGKAKVINFNKWSEYKTFIGTIVGKIIKIDKENNRYKVLLTLR